MKKVGKKIFIYGVPGVGKTHSSKILGRSLNIPVLEGDKIKNKARRNHPKDKYPFLYLGTCKAYKEFGSLNQENVIKGLLAVRNAMRKAVDTEIQSSRNIILEGAFLDPISLKGLGKVILFTTNDEKTHKKQFLHHREKLLDFISNEFKAARILQEYLISEAKSLGIQIIDNNNNIEKSLLNLF